MTSSMDSVTDTIDRLPMTPKSENPRKPEMARVARPSAVVRPDVRIDRPVDTKVSESATSRGLSTISCRKRFVRWME